MSIKKCCVPNCNTTREDNIIMHVFPNPDKDLVKFNAWKNAIGGHIVSLDPITVFRHRRVCHFHFETHYHTWSKRLSADAVPTLHLTSGKNSAVDLDHNNGEITLISHTDDLCQDKPCDDKGTSLDLMDSDAQEDQKNSPHIQESRCDIEEIYIATCNTLQNQNVSPESIATRSEIDELLIDKSSQNCENCQKPKDFDKYDRFALNIAAKIRECIALSDRAPLMISIKNLVYETINKNNTQTIHSSETDKTEITNPLSYTVPQHKPIISSIQNSLDTPISCISNPTHNPVISRGPIPPDNPEALSASNLPFKHGTCSVSTVTHNILTSQSNPTLTSETSKVQLKPIKLRTLNSPHISVKTRVSNPPYETVISSASNTSHHLSSKNTPRLVKSCTIKSKQKLSTSISKPKTLHTLRAAIRNAKGECI